MTDKYRRLDPTDPYCTWEYRKLIADMRKKSPFRKQVMSWLNGKEIWAPGYRGHKKAVPYGTLRNWMKKRLPETYRLMYAVELRQIPLFIHNKFEIMNAVAIWRLEIGR